MSVKNEKFIFRYKNNFILFYSICSLIILLQSFRYYKELYSYFSLLFLVPVLISVTYVNLKNNSFRDRYFLYELILLFFISILGFIFSAKNLEFSKNYFYMFLIMYIYLSLIRYESYKLVHFIIKTLKTIINLSGILMIIWIAYFYLFKCHEFNHCSLMYVSRQFHYHIIFNSNLFNIFLLFALFQFFNYQKNMDKFFFLSVSILSLSSVSMVINFLYFFTILYYFFNKYIPKKIFEISLFVLFFILLIIIFNFSEKLIFFFQNNIDRLTINNIINNGEINSIIWRLEKLEDFKEYFISTLFVNQFKFIFGNQVIQHNNYFHNSFFSIFHFYGMIILLYLTYKIIKLKDVLQIFLFISYFYTTDNLILHNFSISFFSWVLLASFSNKNKYL